MTLVVVSGAVAALQERWKTPAKALSYIHIESLYVNSVHSYSPPGWSEGLHGLYKTLCLREVFQMI